MSRFSVDLSEVSEERILVPQGAYAARIVKAEPRTGTKDDRNWMMLNLTLAIRDEEVSKLLSQDEPKLYYSVGMRFEEDYKLSKNNPDLGALLKMLGLKDKTEAFEEGTEEAESQWDYNLLFYKHMCEALVGYDVLANVVHKPDYKDPDAMQAEINKLAKLEN